MRIAGPDLGAVDPVPPADLLRPRADGSEVGARVRLAHADGEGQLAARDPRQEALALLLGAEAQQERTALPVGDPMRGDGSPGRQHLLEHHVPLQGRALVPPVLLRPRQADPAAGADLLAEFTVEPAPRPRARVG